MRKINIIILAMLVFLPSALALDKLIIPSDSSPVSVINSDLSIDQNLTVKDSLLSDYIYSNLASFNLIMNLAVEKDTKLENIKDEKLDDLKSKLVAKCGHLKFSSAMPFAFTEQGIAMLSAVLKRRSSKYE